MSTISKLLSASAISFALFAGAAPVHANTLQIDFEGTGAPCCFASTSQLTNYYAAQGLNFSGVNGIGGSILNQSGNFGFSARSGTDFLAFNLGMTANVEEIRFTNGANRVSIWAANAFGGTMTMQAFDAQNQLIASDAINSSTSWTQLQVAAPNIASVRLIGAGQYYAYDDLSVSAVPEAETWGLMLVGLAALTWRARRKTAATAV